MYTYIFYTYYYILYYSDIRFHFHGAPMTVFETILNCTPVIPNISHIHNTHHRHRRHVSNFRAGQIIFYWWLWYFTMTHCCYDERWVFVFFYEACIIAFVAYYYATRSMYTERHCGVSILLYYMHIDANHQRTFFIVFCRYMENRSKY